MTVFLITFVIVAVLCFCAVWAMETLSHGFGQSTFSRYFWLYLTLSSIVVGLVAGLIVYGIFDLFGKLFS